MITDNEKILAAQAYLKDCHPDFTDYDEWAGEQAYYDGPRVVAAFIAGVQWALRQTENN